MNLNYGTVLKRAFEITKANRSLWFFGFLLALFGGSLSPNFGGNFQGDTGIKSTKLPNIDPSTLTLIIILVAVVVLLIILISIFFTFLARGALIDMVNDIDNKKAVSIKSGFKGGLTFIFPLLGISLVIGIPFFIAILLLGALLLGPGILLLVVKQTAIGIILIILGGLVWLAALIVGAVAITIITLYADRYLIIEDTGILESIRRAFSLLRANIGPSIILWLINVAISIAQGVGVLIIFVILGLPIILLAMVTTWWLLLLLIVPAFIIVFISGLFQAFFSTYWTLAFQELTKITNNK